MTTVSNIQLNFLENYKHCYPMKMSLFDLTCLAQHNSTDSSNGMGWVWGYLLLTNGWQRHIQKADIFFFLACPKYNLGAIYMTFSTKK